MWEPEGCCCFTRKTGCLILGSLNVGFSLLLFIILGILTSVLTTVDIHESIDEICNRNGREIMENCQDMVYKGIVVGLVCCYIGTVIELVFSSMLIHGVRKELPCLMVPKMVMMLIGLILSILSGVVGTVQLAIMNVELMFIHVAIHGSLIFLGTYYLLVMRTHYLELKRGTASIHTALIEEPVDEIKCKDKYFQ